MDSSHKKAGRRAIGVTLALLVATASSTLILDGKAGGAPKAAPAAAPAFQYVAKFVCVSEVGPPSTAVVNQGTTTITYRTVVNVHNPNTKDVKIGKKAAGAASENSPVAGKIGQVKTLVLVPDQVLMIDCHDINGLLGGVQPNGDGVVVVYSNQPLDIWAVYTMRGTLTPSGGGAATAINGNIDVVHVAPSTFS